MYCDADKHATCILPNPVRSPEIKYITEQPETWLSDIEDGMKVIQVEINLHNNISFQCVKLIIIIFNMCNIQITYKADSNQIGFLQLLSKLAYQNITYHCKNSIGYFDSIRKTYRKGMKFLTWNDAELTPRGNQRLRYEMITDECKVSFKLFRY